MRPVAEALPHFLWNKCVKKPQQRLFSDPHFIWEKKLMPLRRRGAQGSDELQQKQDFYTGVRDPIQCLCSSVERTKCVPYKNLRNVFMKHTVIPAARAT